MKSLFLRLLVSLWLAMALLVGLLAVIHGWAFSAEPSGLRRRLSTRSIELRAESALACQREGLPGCEQRLAPLDPRDSRVAVYRAGALVIGEPIEGAPLVEEKARRSGDGIAIEVGEEREVSAVVLHRDPELAAVATGPVRSPWMFFIVPETLPQRLLAIVAVTGLVAVLLARYLSRPVRILRGATQRMAAGDLSVRVSQKLAGADGETLALGRDMDRMAERIDELLETQRRLLRDVSHELRSPLARLNIALELVRRRSPPDVEPAFDRIERETERLNGMIGELLTLSRLESGRGMERTERFDLTALLEQLVEDAAFEAEQRGCSVELGARDACSLDGNEELLRRAIENVVRNAVRFTEAGTAVRIDLERSGGTAEVRVRDRGPGVPEGALADLWKPFYRVDDHRARGAGGTGIGLAITQRAVLIHGGEVEARNADGGGLEVVLRLPVGAEG
ncbi:ATP-binding protein [Sorangium sp. So ce375]|uniref:ATP-binding protein n=1 Tax=Sorangium sp. So ce375 TaxID=3133306 RepID=UPI003F5C1845